jgi:hypothetical protein
MKREYRLALKIGMIMPVLVVLAIFSYSLQDLSSPVVLKAFPSVPKEGEPIVVAFTLKNYDNEDKTYRYELYANGGKVIEGETKLPEFSSKNYVYSYRNPLKLGEQVSFHLRVTSPAEVHEASPCSAVRIKSSCLTGEAGVYENSISIPAYPPQVWSSFVSFAAFSTAISSLSTSISTSTSTISMASMAYYRSTYGFDQAVNVGVIFSIVLLFILIQVELTEPFTRALNILGRLKPRFNRLSMVLFIIFMAMVFTEIIMIIG